jgi:hypothetical protein
MFPIYAIEIWRDEIGFDGYYKGPYFTHEEAAKAAQEECERLGYTWEDKKLGLVWGSNEELINGDDKVQIIKENIESDLIYHILKTMAHYADSKGYMK